MKRIPLFWLCLLLAGYDLHAQTTLFTYGSAWKYLDNGSDQGTAWRTPGFNDAAWSIGNGKFGYGLPGLTTVVNYGPNANQKYITTYFRKTISIANPAMFSSFTGGVLRDDGIVVYVNGAEVFKNNMKKGEVTYQTLGQDAADNATVTQFFDISSSLFVSGNNVIAVEIHQKTVTNFDLGFDMQLSGIGAMIDLTPPFAVSINRQAPAGQFTQDTTVTYRATFSEKVSGVNSADFSLTTVDGTVTGALSDTSVTAVDADSLSYDIKVHGIQGTGTIRLDLNASGTGITDTAGNAISGGFTAGETYSIEESGAPVVTSITRLSPADENTDATAVTFRVLFSRKVRDVDAVDFILTTWGGNVRGTLTRLSPQAASSGLTDAVQVTGADSTTWDVTVRAIAGSGMLRLDVKDNNTEITDAEGNALFGGFTGGESYTINAAPMQGFTSFQDLSPIISSSSTREMPQAKVWYYADKWWSIFATSGGTKVFRLDGAAWTDVLTIASSSNSRADCRVVGNLVHVLLFRGASTTSYFVSLEYDPISNNYKKWTQRTSNVNIVFESGAITATLDIDSTNRIWIASNTTSSILVRYSDPPYSTWSAPIPIASGITNEDFCGIIHLPGKTGVFWSNQNTKRFGFRTHNDGDDPTAWGPDEVPASQSALNTGDGMADNHLNMTAASDGTLYCAIKTGYDKNGFPAIGLLVRRPNNTWDNLYPVTSSKEGNRPVVILNEATGKLKVMYSTHLDNPDRTRNGDILYRESPLSSIAFGPPVTLMGGKGINHFEYVTSTHQTYNPAIVIMAMMENISPNTIVSMLATDESAPEMMARKATTTNAPVPAMQVQSEVNTNNLKAAALARPNPFTNSTTIDFSLSQAGRYTIRLYDLTGRMVKVVKQGFSEAGVRNNVRIDGAQLPNGLYQVNIQTDQQVRTLKLLKY